MKLKIILLALAFLVACAPVCPPGTTLGPDGVCCEGEEGVCEEEIVAETGQEEPDESAELQEQLDEQIEDETEPIAEEPTEPTDANDAIAPAEKEEEPAPVDTTIMGELKAAYDNKVTSYEFGYGSRRYQIRGDRIKVILEDSKYLRDVKLGNTTVRLAYYDTIYIEGNKAEAYCEGYEGGLRRECEKLEISDVPIPVNYEEFVIKFPHEWLAEYAKKTPQKVERNKYHLQNRAVTLVVFPGYEMYFDPLIGLPLKIIADGEAERFENLVSNTVPEAEMTHRTYVETLQ